MGFGDVNTKSRSSTPASGGFGNVGRNRDLKSVQGLYDVAVQSGLQRDADRILAANQGEQTKEIFSGGFISDTFDVLNALQYGVVGLLKGKTFSEGVKTRQSFSDKDALGDKGIPGLIAGVALDIAFDPLTYVAPATIVRKVPILGKALKAGKEALFGKRVTKAIKGTDKTFESLEGGTRLGKYLGSKFAWMFGADPVYRETFERGTKNIAISTQELANFGKTVSKIKPETAARLLKRDETERFFRLSRSALPKLGLKPDQLEAVTKLYDRIDTLGAEAVDLGLLSKSKFEENFGKYLKSSFLEHETAKAKFPSAGKIGVTGIKSRKPGKVSDFGLTQIDNPAYLLFKSAFDLNKDVQNSKLLREMAQKFGSDVAQEGFTKKAFPKTVKWGALGGKHIPQHMADYLTEIIEPAAGSLAKSTVANFKFFKVIMNPATHARNIVSNRFLNWWKLGMNPLDPRTISAETEALKEIVRGTGKWTKEARPLGYDLNTFASAEMKTLLDSPEALQFSKSLGSKWAKFKETFGNIYQKEENQAKLSAYIFNRKKGVSPEEAWKAAESATFNYAQVTPFIRKLRESLFGFPFITFTAKATPVAIETALKNPKRIGVIGKIKQAIESQADIKMTDRERAAEPPWVKDGFYIKLPMKDKHGRSVYFDMTYILPFGDLISGQFLERGVDLKTGLPESGVTSALKKSPFISTIAELGKNQDFFGNRIWKTSDPAEKQVADLMRHLSKTYLPPLVSDQLPGGYNERGERQQRGLIGALKRGEEDLGQRRDVMQEILRNVGAKVQPIDADIQESFQEWNQKKGLRNLLLENFKHTNVDDFTGIYTPKQ